MKRFLCSLLFVLPFLPTYAGVDSLLFNTDFVYADEFGTSSKLKLYENGNYRYTSSTCGFRSGDTGTYSIKGNRFITHSLKNGDKMRYRIVPSGNSVCLQRKGATLSYQKGRGLYAGKYSFQYDAVTRPDPPCGIELYAFADSVAVSCHKPIGSDQITITIINYRSHAITFDTAFQEGTSYLCSQSNDSFELVYFGNAEEDAGDFHEERNSLAVEPKQKVTFRRHVSDREARYLYLNFYYGIMDDGLITSAHTLVGSNINWNLCR